MRNEIMRHFNLAREFRQTGYFETEHLKEIFWDVKEDIKLGKLIAISGMVGAGKTAFLKRLQDDLTRDKEILVARSLSLDKGQVTVSALMLALFMDLTAKGKDKEIKVPAQSEKRDPQAPGNHPEIKEDGRPFCGRSPRHPRPNIERLEAVDGGRSGG